MKNILVLGATPKSEEEINFYNSITEICKNFTQDVKSPVDTIHFKGNDQERYDRAFQLVKDYELIIGDQSKPSTGQGMEVRECAILEKPLIVIAKEGSQISGLVKGCPATKEILYYKNIEDIKSQLMDVLGKY